MMRGLIATSIRARGLVLAVAVLVFGLGVVQLSAMPVDVLPEFGKVKVEVRTEALGLSAYEVEQLITAPMEQNLLNGVAFLENVSSKSVPGLAAVELTFEDGTDPLDARQVVQERLTEASKALPNVSKAPTLMQPRSSTSRVMMIGLRATEIPLLELSVLARWNIRPQLMGVPGVANVSIWGQRDQQLQVLVDPQRLLAEGLTLDQIIATTGNALWVSPLSFLKASAPGRGGFVDTPAQRLGVQHINPILTADDLARVAVEPSRTAAATTATTRVPGPTKQLGEVTVVQQGHQPLIGDGVVSDETGLMLVVEKLPGANALEVTKGVERELSKLTPGLTGVEIAASVFRPATYIETSRDNLAGLLLIGLALAILAFAALTFSWRSVLVSIISAAVSLAAALLLLAWMGETLNVMILAGLILAITLIVDDVVGDRDSIERSLRSAPENDAAKEDDRSLDSIGQRILRGSLSFRGPLGYSTVALLLLLVPLFVLTGEAEAFLPVVARALGAAVLASLVVALTVTPALSRLLGSPARPAHDPRFVARLNRTFARIANRVTATRAIAYVSLVVIAVLGLGSMAFLERDDSLIPRFEDTDLLVRWEGPTGTSLPEMNRISARVSKELRGVKGIDNVGAHTGRAVLSDDIGGANAGELWVSIDPTVDYDATLDAVKEVINGYPGLARGVTEYSSDRIASGSDAESGDITVRIFGQEHSVLQQKADEIARGLKAIDGVTRTDVERLEIEPTVEVDVDLDAAERAGITPGDVRRLVATYVQGLEVGSLFVDQKVFDVVVQGVPEVRGNLDDIQSLPIATPNLGLVRLADLARVQIGPNPSVIKHEAVVRSLDVHAFVDGDADDLIGAVDDVVARTSFPIEHHAEVLGNTAARNSARNQFLFAILGVAVAIFLLLQAAFTSWRLALAIFFTVPFSAAGGAFAHWLLGDVVTIGSVVGFIAIVGIALRFTMVLIGRFQYPDGNGVTEESAAPTPDLVATSVRERFMPIIMTVVVGIAIMLPLVVAGSRPGTEIVRPMAAVLVGGLITAALYALIVVPTLYLQFAPHPNGGGRSARRGGGGGRAGRNARSGRSSRRFRRGRPPFETQHQSYGLEESA